MKTFKLLIALTLVLLFTASTYAQEASGTYFNNVREQANKLSANMQDSEALKVAEKGLKVAETTYGPEHPDVVKYLELLADLSDMAGKRKSWENYFKNRANDDQTLSLLAQSTSLYKRALAIMEKHHGTGDPKVVNSLIKLAKNYSGQHKYDQADPIYKRALAIMEKHYGPDHPEVVSPLMFLGVMYVDQKKYDQAELIYKRALSIMEKNYGTVHPKMEWDLLRISGSYDRMGKKEEATKLKERARISKLGGSHFIRAQQLEKEGKYLGALIELGECLKILEDRHYLQSEGRIEIRRAMAQILKKMPVAPALPEEARKHAIRAEELVKMGKFYDAAKEYEDAIKIAPYIPLLYYNLALVYAETGWTGSGVAVGWMKAYLDLVPDAPDARAGQDKIYKWELMREKGGK